MNLMQMMGMAARSLLFGLLDRLNDGDDDVYLLLDGDRVLLLFPRFLL
jgi:hypothetical protein